jgi:hypothetical protein
MNAPFVSGEDNRLLDCIGRKEEIRFSIFLTKLLIISQITLNYHA